MRAPQVLAKKVAEGVLAAPGLVRRRLAARRGQVLILAWHNIVPEGERAAGELSLHTDSAEFAAQLDALAANVPVIALRSLLDGTWAGERAAVVITFDDAYRGAVLAGGAELTRRRMPSTVFVAPAFVGGRTFWWDRMAASTGSIPAAERARLLTELEGDDARIRAEVENTEPQLPAHASVADLDELRSATGSGLMEIGSHSWSHRNLAALDAAEIEHDLRRADVWLENEFGDVVPALALPYGYGADVVHGTTGHGCRAALRIDGGWATPVAGPFQILPRLNIPRGLTPRGLLARLAGFLT